MAARDVAVRIRQDPVVGERSPDGATFLMVLAHVVVADKVAVLADNLQGQSHGETLVYAAILRGISEMGCYLVHIMGKCGRPRGLETRYFGP